MSDLYEEVLATASPQLSLTVQNHPPRQTTFSPTDALLGELLRHMLELRDEVGELRQMIAELKAPATPAAPTFPANALRHSR